MKRISDSDADDCFETRYWVTLTVGVTLTGLPFQHTHKAIHENVMSRLNAGDSEDLDRVEIAEVIRTE